MKHLLILGFLALASSVGAQCVVRITEGAKTIYLAADQLAYILPSGTGSVIFMQGGSGGALLAIEPVDTIVSRCRPTLLPFTDNTNGRRMAVSKTFITRIIVGTDNKARIFTRNPQISYVSAEDAADIEDIESCYGMGLIFEDLVPGVYVNPTIRVRPDGRIDFIENGLICCTGDSVYVQTFGGLDDLEVTIRALPSDTNAIFVYLNGQFIRDYTVVGNDIVPTIPIYPEDSIAVMFFISTNTFFRSDYAAMDTISHTAPTNAIWFVYVNGLQTIQYSLTSSELILNFPVEPEDVISVTHFATTLNHYLQNFNPAPQTVSVTICPLPALSNYIAAFFNGQFTRMFTKAGNDLVFDYSPDGLIHAKIFR